MNAQLLSHPPMQVREALRRDSEGERVRFEAERKRAREAAARELEEVTLAETARLAGMVADHGRELSEVSVDKC